MKEKRIKLRIIVKKEDALRELKFTIKEWRVLQRIYLGESTIDKMWAGSRFELACSSIRRALSKFQQLDLVREVTQAIKVRSMQAGRPYKCGATNRLRVFDLTPFGISAVEAFQEKVIKSTQVTL